MPDISEHTVDLGGQPAFWLQADGGTPIVYLHGVPTSAEDWRPFLARTGGIAPDLPGFGRSGKRADLPCTMEFYDAWIEQLLDHLGVDRFRLLVHDWGAVGLLPAMRLAGRVERLVVMNAVPFLAGYRWHRTARIWRTRGAGELLMGAFIRPTIRRGLREAFAMEVPEPFLEDVVRFFDPGTQRAILKLYRSSPPDKLAAAGARLGDLDCPALVVWGDRDPYIPARFADDYAAALGGPATVEHVAGAGHWPWLDRPEVVDLVTTFLAADART